MTAARAAIADATSPQAACEAIRPAFAALLTDEDWLPATLRAPPDTPPTGMGGGIGQWLLSRAGDRSLMLL